MPDKLQLDGGNSISNLYGSDGTKLRTTRFINGKTTTTDYCGSAIYENGVLSKVLTEDGYITAQDNKAHYFIQDHQGNTRVVVDNGGKVEEFTHYYPFGGIFSSTNNVQPYKYNGKELDRSGGLDWYDYGARMYDAAIGRWHVVDPMAEKYYSSNPYNYCDNEPVGRIDPDGADWIQDNFGFYLWDNAATSQDLTRSNWTYIGADLPDDVSGYRILEEIGGSLYHKNTINPFASLINSIFGEGTLVEKKRYDPSEEHMMQQAVNTGAEMSLGLVGGKLTGRLVAKVLTKTQKTSLVKTSNEGLLTPGDMLRIENAATKLKKPIYVVGSRASGKTKAYSDWDYIIDGLTNKEWKGIKNSLPGAKSILNNTPRNIDIIREPIDVTKPYIKINPK